LSSSHVNDGPARLHDKENALRFYEERYAQGYMDDWPIERKRRIAEVIRRIALPRSGEAIDFGCGNGVLTEVLRYALPDGWRISGTDLSDIAVENASRRFPDCRFFHAEDPALRAKKFDFLFTHHVLEHVYDLRTVLAGMVEPLTHRAVILHILPCGNEGSFEHAVCAQRTDGVDPGMEGRFFYEDEGHVRRLTTERMIALHRELGFELEMEFYANQEAGAVEWISGSGPSFIQGITASSSAVDNRAARRLSRLRIWLTATWALRFPALFVESQLRNWRGGLKRLLALLVLLPFYPFSKPIDLYVRHRADVEWREKAHLRNGSEMFLVFSREGAHRVRPIAE